MLTINNNLKKNIKYYINELLEFDEFNKSIISYNIDKTTKHGLFSISVISNKFSNFKINIYFDEYKKKEFFDISKLMISSDVCIWLDEFTLKENKSLTFNEKIKYCLKYIQENN